MHIAIAGNIGSGKTTLTKMLAAHYGWIPKFESVDFNPYLSDFYEDMERWSFNLQIYFLNKRFKDVVEIAKTDDVIIQDRTIYEDARIFAPNLHDMGLMSTRDFENYTDLFDLMMSLVGNPDLLIYLRSSIPNLISQIQKRGREYEKSIRIDYLTGLNEKYENWIKDYDGNLLIIDADHIKFGNRPEDFEKVTDMIDAQLYGLFAQRTRFAFLPTPTAVWRNHESVSQPTSFSAFRRYKKERIRMWRWLDKQYPGRFHFCRKRAILWYLWQNFYFLFAQTKKKLYLCSRF